MVVLMQMDDDRRMADYARVVPGLLEEHGARTLGGGCTLVPVEDDLGLAVAPNRAVVLEFQSSGAAAAFVADPRYVPFNAVRHAHPRSAIHVFDNEVDPGRPLA